MELRDEWLLPLGQVGGAVVRGELEELVEGEVVREGSEQQRASGRRALAHTLQ